MAMAPQVEKLLAQAGARYQLVSHPRSHTSIQTADYADIPGDRLVKAVLLEDEQGKVMAALPSTRSVHIGHLTTQLDRRLRLADEDELPGLFPDCRPGAFPPVGPAYGLRMIVDSSLDAAGEVYFEAGDHESLVRMDGAEFLRIIGTAPRVDFAVAERHHTQKPLGRPPGTA
jgi:Ala-tRNA(Pro) deacylase